MKRQASRIVAALVYLSLSASAQADIVIGLAGPKTSRFATVGEAMRASAEAAISKANASGGISGEMLKLEVADDGCAGAEAQVAARKLVESGARIVIGHTCANAAVAAAPIYAAASVVMISLTRHGLLTDRRAGPGIFRLAGRDDQQGQEAARYVANAHKDAPVAIVHDRTSYARALADGFLSALAAQGLAPVLNEGIVASEKDYSAVAARIKAAGARLVYFAGFPAEAAIVLSELRTIGSPTLLVGADALASADFAERAGQDAEGSIVLVSSAADLAAAAGRSAAAAIEVTVESLRTNPSATSVLVAHLASAAFQTSIGQVSFDAKGDASIASFAIHRWKDGRLVAAE